MSHNLALRSPEERLAVAADKEACRLRHYRKDKGREWIVAELDKMAPDLSALVRERLNAHLKTRKGQ